MPYLRQTIDNDETLESETEVEFPECFSQTRLPPIAYDNETEHDTVSTADEREK